MILVTGSSGLIGTEILRRLSCSCGWRKAGERQADKVLTDRDGHGQCSSLKSRLPSMGRSAYRRRTRAFAFDIEGRPSHTSSVNLRELDAPRYASSNRYDPTAVSARRTTTCASSWMRRR